MPSDVTDVEPLVRSLLLSKAWSIFLCRRRTERTWVSRPLGQGRGRGGRRVDQSVLAMSTPFPSTDPLSPAQVRIEDQGGRRTVGRKGRITTRSGRASIARSNKEEIHGR